MLLLGTFTLLAGTWTLRSTDRSQDRQDFERNAALLGSDFRRILTTEFQVLRALRALYAASKSVEPGEFAAFHANIKPSMVGVTQLAYVELVEPSALSEHEDKARADGLAGYRVWSTGRPTLSQPQTRSTLLPIIRMAPCSPTAAALGRDLAADVPGFEAALLAAAAEDSMFAVNTSVDRPVDRRGSDLLVGLPVFANNAPTATPEQRRKHLIGAAMVTIDTRLLLMLTRSATAAEWASVEVVDRTGSVPALRVDQTGNREPREPRIVIPIGSEVAGLKLELVCTDNRDGVPWSARTWSALIGGAVSLLFAAQYLLTATRSTLRVESLVQARTSELEQSTALMTAIVESAPDLIANLDHRCEVLVCNTAGASMLGLESVDLVGSSFTEVLLGDAAASLTAFCATESLQGRLRLEVRARRADRTTFPIELTASRVPNSTIVTVIGRDITHVEIEKMHADQQRQGQKLEAIGQLAAGIAHEINTPIQYVSDNVSFLQQAFADVNALLRGVPGMIEQLPAAGTPPERIEELRALQAAADLEYLDTEIPTALKQSREGLQRVAEIVRAMKEFSHPADQMLPTDLNRAIQTTLTVTRNEWKYVADAECQLAPDLPLVPCLPGEVNQVFLNMIVNASHAIADIVGDGANGKGRITVRTGRDGDQVKIEITDTGAGIPENIRNRIYEPFFTTKPVGKGTGQGLAIAFNVVVTKHHGTLSVSSEVGKGTTFVIRLPIEQPEPVVSAPRPVESMA